VKEEIVERQENTVSSQIVEQTSIKEDRDKREAPLSIIESTTSLLSSANKESSQDALTNCLTEQQKEEPSTMNSQHCSDQMVAVSVPLQSPSPLRSLSVSIPLHSSPSPHLCSDIVKELTKPEIRSPTASPLSSLPPSPTRSNQLMQSPNNSKRIVAINNLWRDIQTTLQPEDERSIEVHRMLSLFHISILKSCSCTGN
jgi:hypothetical protein